MPKNRRFSDCPKVAAKPSSADWNILVHLPGVPAHFRTDGRLALSTAAQNSTPHKRSRGPVCCGRGNFHVNGHRDGRVKVCGTRRISPQTLTADVIVQVLRGDTQAIAVLEVVYDKTVEVPRPQVDEPTQDPSTDAARSCLVETPVSLPSCSHNATCATISAEGSNSACNRVQQFAVHRQGVLYPFLAQRRIPSSPMTVLSEAIPLRRLCEIPITAQVSVDRHRSTRSQKMIPIIPRRLVSSPVQFHDESWVCP